MAETATQATTSTSTQASVRTPPPPFKIGNIGEESSRLKLLVYAQHGIGKTTLAGSVVDVESMNDVIMINAESGDTVMQNNKRIKNIGALDIIPVDRFDTVVKIYEFLTSHVKFRNADDLKSLRKQEGWLKGVNPDLIENPRKYKTVIIDSLTEVEAYCMYKLLGVHGEFSTEMLNEDTKTAEFKEYKQNNNMMNLLVRAFRDLDMNVIVLCGRVFEQDEMKRFHYGPALTGKLRNQVQGYFDIVGYLVAGKAPDGGEAPRRLWVQPEGKWDAKNRFADYKQNHFDNPTMSTIVKELGIQFG